jgi:hypothetical protein
LGNIAGQYVQDRAANKAAEAKSRELSRRDTAFLDLLGQSGGNPNPLDVFRLFGPDRAPKIIEGLNGFHALAAKQGEEAAKHIPQVIQGLSAMSPELRNKAYPAIRDLAIKSGAIPEGLVPEDPEEGWKFISSAMGPKPPAPAPLLKVGPNEVVLDPETHQPVFTAPAAPKDPSPRVVGRSLVDESGKVIYRDPEAPDKSGNNKVWVMRTGPDGKMAPVFIPESQVMAGDRPANTREQGRPITAGDAGRIADIDNGILQAQNLKADMNTGVGSWLGAKAVPDFVTQATGIGAESKKQQAQIQLVKQIIGKGLEGGVLRKEDEAKYERILPKLGDPPEVAQGKIDELISMLGQKKEIELSAREDAGYDVTRFRERETKKTQSKSGPVKFKASDGITYTFPNQAALDAAKADGLR